MVNNLRNLDLNLLITLDVLLKEHNVTRAAERLHLSQPTVSVQLARLRKIFGDPLFIPGPRGMRSTARADELREPLRHALAALEEVFSPSNSFNPAQATQHWHVSAFDYGVLTALRPALAGLREAAPSTRIAVVHILPSQAARKAEQGEIDLLFMTSSEAPLSLHRRKLFSERYVLVGRKGNIHLQKPLTLDKYCQLEHVIVSPEGGGFHGATDTVLAERGMTRRVSLSVPGFLLLCALLESSDLVAMLPWRLVCENDALEIVEPPVEVPGFEMVMLWPERVHRDQAHKWLREHIVSSMSKY
jgi:Transcriptional regulator